jgi:hypothetical protein
MWLERPAYRPPGSPRGRRLLATLRAVASARLARETALVLLAYFAYFLVRGLTEGERAGAIERAHRIVDIEKACGFFWEPAIQSHLAGYHAIITAANWMYIWGHWPLIGIVAAWLIARRPAAYQVYRNAFFVSGAIGILVFVLFPVAPPRLAGVGLADTVTMYSQSYRVLQPPAFVNQYAAVPSLHFGWDLLIGIALITESRWLAARVLGAIVPLLMLAAIVITANHYIFDAVAGAAVALTGLAVSCGLQSAWRRGADAKHVERAGAGLRYASNH